MAAGCAIIGRVMTPETEARIRQAGERYAEVMARTDAERSEVRADLVAAMKAGRAEDPDISNEKIARLTPLSNTHVFRLLKANTAES
jgi:hypothetical protein